MDEDSMSESSDDESGEFLTAELNEQIQKTLLNIRSNNPIIYEKDVTFFSAPVKREKKIKVEKDTQTNEENESGEKLPDVKFGEFLREEKMMKEEKKNFELPERSIEEYYLGSGKNELIKDLQIDENSDDEFFEVKENPKNEMDIEEEVENKSTKEGVEWVQLSKDPEKDTFLQNYMSGEWWKEKNSNSVPAYDGISGFQELLQEGKVAETKFRHEEVNDLQLITYARTVEGGIRKKKSKRKRYRKHKQEKEKLLVEQRKKEIKREKKKIEYAIKKMIKYIKNNLAVQLPNSFMAIQNEFNLTNWDDIIENNDHLDNEQTMELLAKLSEIQDLVHSYYKLDYQIESHGDDTFKFSYKEVVGEEI